MGRAPEEGIAMSNFRLQIIPYAGTDIDRACSEAVKLADHLWINVEFRFNDVVCLAQPGDKASHIVDSFHKEATKKHGYKFASDRGPQ
jgi:hypothetical protein